jgi:hypothetical protein
MVPFHLSFKNEHTIYEKIVKCTVKASEMNLSYNPSLLQPGSQENMLQFVTGSNFSPYATSIGLYNNEGTLMAVGKFGQPLPMSTGTDYNIILKLDF